MKILLIAHEYSPNIGSECQQGWRLVREIATQQPLHDVHVLCATGNQFETMIYKVNIEKHIREHEIPANLHHIYINYGQVAKILGWLNNSMRKYFGPIGFPPLFYLTYAMWERKAYQKIYKDYGVRYFDIVHKINLINASIPGPWWRLKTRLFWGPTGGLLEIPNIKYITFAERLRNIFVKYKKHSKNYQKFISNSEMIYQFDSPPLRETGVKFLPDVALDDVLPYHPRLSDEYVIFFSGHYNYRKGFEKYLQVVSAFKDNTKVKFKSFGKGPLQNLVKQIRNNNYEDFGLMPRQVYLDKIRQHDILLALSYREANCSALNEAIANNVLVISTNVGGIQGFVIDELLIDYKSDDYVVERAIHLIKTLVANRGLYNRYLEQQLRKSQRYTYDVAVQTIVEDYKS